MKIMCFLCFILSVLIYSHILLLSSYYPGNMDRQIPIYDILIIKKKIPLQHAPNIVVFLALFFNFMS